MNDFMAHDLSFVLATLGMKLGTTSGTQKSLFGYFTYPYPELRTYGQVVKSKKRGISFNAFTALT